jgi:hypothetical protein
MTELLLALSLINQNPTVTIPIDPATLQAQVTINTTFKDAQGVTWELKGTLIARPTAAAPPASSTTPLINAYRDLDGEWLETARPGQRFLVIGEGFGEAGSVSYAANAVTARSWTDSLIIAELPAVQWPGDPSALTVRREDGAHYTGLAFGVK